MRSYLLPGKLKSLRGAKLTTWDRVPLRRYLFPTKRESRRGVKFTTNNKVPVRRYLLPGKLKSLRGAKLTTWDRVPLRRYFNLLPGNVKVEGGQTHNMGQGSIETVFVAGET